MVSGPAGLGSLLADLAVVLTCGPLRMERWVPYAVSLHWVISIRQIQMVCDTMRMSQVLCAGRDFMLDIAAYQSTSMLSLFL